jgi:hypothetical protein
VRPTGPDGTPALSDIFLIPQRIHMTMGSLADQITVRSEAPPCTCPLASPSQ